jgi:hypothetical protein
MQAMFTWRLTPPMFTMASFWLLSLISTICPGIPKHIFMFLGGVGERVFITQRRRGAESLREGFLWGFIIF